jgi:hypothetical protein
MKKYYYVNVDGEYCSKPVTKGTFDKGKLQGKLHFQQSRTKGLNDLDLFMKSSLIGYFFEKKSDQIQHLKNMGKLAS